MTRIVINGCAGRMGGALAETAAQRKDCTITAGMDPSPARPGCTFLTFQPFTYEGEADVIIDASNCEDTEALMAYALRRRLPTVVMTTGQNEAQMDCIRAASGQIPIFKSGNMSLGINVLSLLCKKAAAILGESFDVEIVEAHHNKKVDAPSGTALMLAKSVSEGLSEQPVYVYDRHSIRQPRAHEEIGIHSIRGGTIVGEHSVIFAGDDEVLTLSHSAGSRKMFANGALNAASFLVGKQPGMYDMDDLLEGLL